MGATLLVLFIKRKDAAESWRVGGCSCNYWTAGLCIKGQSEGKCVSVDLGNAFGVCVCCWGRGRGGDVAHNPRNILKIARLWQIGSSGGSRWLWGDLWELAFFIRGGRDGQSRCKREAGDWCETCSSCSSQQTRIDFPIIRLNGYFEQNGRGNTRRRTKTKANLGENDSWLLAASWGALTVFVYIRMSIITPPGGQGAHSIELKKNFRVKILLHFCI